MTTILQTITNTMFTLATEFQTRAYDWIKEQQYKQQP